MCYGGILCARAVYCVLGWCTVWYGYVMCGRALLHSVCMTVYGLLCVWSPLPSVKAS